jgi:HSP20 family molecular chaperone IbpA
MDMGTVFDEIFETAQNLHNEFNRNFNNFEGRTQGEGYNHRWTSGEDSNVDYYPNYLYPPMNVYMIADRSMVFEFALAGFDEKDITLSFQGDYMVFSARLSEQNPTEEGVRYFKRRLKMKDIEKQKYFVPQDKYAQDKVKAAYKNGILKVTIPTKDEPDQNSGIKIEIIKESI